MNFSIDTGKGVMATVIFNFSTPEELNKIIAMLHVFRGAPLDTMLLIAPGSSRTLPKSSVEDCPVQSCPMRQAGPNPKCPGSRTAPELPPREPPTGLG